MPKITRRDVVSCLAALGATQFLPKLLARAERRAIPPSTTIGYIPVRVAPDWTQAGSTIPEEMLGLSYESAQLSAPNFFSAANVELIQLFRELSPHGILRLGGNTSEFTRWTPSGSAAPATDQFRAVAPDPGAEKDHEPIPVTPAAIRNLREFLDRTDWHAIYGIGLVNTKPARAAEEAKFVTETLGARLIALQIGNEPNHYVLNHLRTPGYSFADYFAEWSRIHKAVIEAAPDARFGGPDVAEGVGWIKQFAAVAPASVVMLTGHHYVEGPPTSPSATIERLLSPDPAFERHVKEVEAISRKAHLPFVMAETNSCYGAGKEGVSNVFASALWAAGYILQLAQAHERGVCFHGGGSSAYTPIAGGSGRPFVARPVYYGLQFCRDFLGQAFAPLNVESGSPEVTVYALHDPHRIVVINKSRNDAEVNLPTEEEAASVRRLVAPSVESQAGAEITAPQRPSANATSIRVPRFSAADIVLRQA